MRPKASDKTTAAAGTLRLGLEPSGRDATLRVPPNADGPLPLLVLLHGAGGTGQRMLQRIAPAVEATNLVVLAIDSRAATWDAIRADFGPDVAYLDRALTRVFETVAIDPPRLVLGGFSDGATYALSLGLINGDIFQSVIAFSPGFVVTGDEPRGTPHFFISHGTADPILPIEGASRVIVPALRNHGYDVTYREFPGVHEVPPAIAAEAMTWAAARRA
jgi:phospholipase/carboxylesterase